MKVLVIEAILRMTEYRYRPNHRLFWRFNQSELLIDFSRIRDCLIEKIMQLTVEINERHFGAAVFPL